MILKAQVVVGAQLRNNVLIYFFVDSCAVAILIVEHLMDLPI